MEEKVDKLYKIVIVLSIIVAVILIMNLSSLFKIKKDEPKTNENETTTETTTNNYDVSSFKKLSTKEVVDLFNDKKKTYVVYVGRATCSACVSFVPTLKEVQTKYNYITQYLDITTVNKDTDEYNALLDKLKTKVTLTVSKETKTQNFSEYFGYTPMTFIIKEGKFKDGIVGAYSKDSFEEFLNKNGIK